MNGSGVTMLLDHMGEHPQLFGYRLETPFLTGCIINARKYGSLNEATNIRRFCNNSRSESAIWKVNKRNPLDLPDDWKDTPRSVAGVFDAMLPKFTARAGKAIKR